ncbi:MAG: PIG-L family deacetylase [Vulcanimicrobiaceae bacterium]
MPHALFLSPHLDDVAFSCGATLYAFAARGWTTTLSTIFTRSIARPAGFALRCQLDKGLAPEIDYLALRRSEDDVAARLLGVARVVRGDLPEAPHRGYHDAAGLFGAYAAADAIAPELVGYLAPQLRACDLVFAPQALGGHVDHRRVRDAVRTIASAATRRAEIVWYRDAPYVLREPDAVPEAALAAGAPLAFGVAIDARALAAKLEAAAAYASQIPFQFGTEAKMRDVLHAFARDEGARFSTHTSSEGFRTANDATLRRCVAIAEDAP